MPVIGPISDDCQGMLCLAQAGCPAGGVPLADGDAVEAYTGLAGPYARRAGPPLVFRTNDFGKVAPLPLFAGADRSGLIESGVMKTPLSAFSNGKAGAASGVFVLFGRAEAVPCGTCAGGFTCDDTLGLAGSAPCVLGTLGCTAAPEGGVCVDPTGPRYSDATPEGHLRGIVYKALIGNADPRVHETYCTRPWTTHKFTNPSVTTVASYTLDASGAGSAHVEDPRLASAGSGNGKVFMWGRPSFVGVRGASAKLYLAVLENPSYSERGEIPWEPRFFAGLDPDGRPRFAAEERDAQALVDVDGSDEEPNDIVNQLSVRYVPELAQWMMMYGGDLEPKLHDAATFGQAGDVERHPQGAVQVRFADEPWGPWTKPEVLMIAGDPAVPELAYGPGGVLHHEACTPEADCAPGEPWWDVALQPGQRGYLYAPNPILEWTELRGDHVDVYWNVSTFSPYQVLLMRSSIRRASP